MDRDKFLLPFVLLFCYLVVVLAVFIFFLKKDTPKTTQNIKDQVEKTDSITSNTKDSSSAPKEYTIGPTVVIEKNIDQGQKDWVVYTNKKYNYSISLPNNLFMSNADIDKTLVYEKGTDKSLDKELFVIYTFLKNQVPDVMKDKYQRLEPGASNSSLKTGFVTTRLQDLILKDGKSFRVYNSKSKDSTIEMLEFVLDGENIYTYISASIDKDSITESQIRKIILTYISH